MNKVAYSAINKDHKTITGYIDANTNEEAIEKLEVLGFQSFELLGDAQFSNFNQDLEGLSSKTLKRMASFEKKRENGQSFIDAFLQFLYNSRVILLISLFMLFSGIYYNDNWGIGIGSTLLVGATFLWLYTYQALYYFEEIHRVKAFGEHEKLLELIEKMRIKAETGVGNKEQIIFELDKYHANALACRGEKEKALSMIEQHRDYLNNILLGMYENSIGSIYYTLGDYKTSLDYMTKMYNANPNSNNALDLAFMHVRFGDITYAKTLIEDEVNPRTIPSYGFAMYYWCLGLIAHKEKDYSTASEHYQTMLEKFNNHMLNPLLWEMIAVGIGYYVDFLYDIGNKNKGEELLSVGIIEILNIHADDILRNNLSLKYPHIFNKEKFCKKYS